MKLIENETKFTHKSMPSWGVGIFRESDGTYITIDFENAGIKKFGMKSIGTTLMVVEEKAEKVVAESKPISQTTYVPVNAQNGALIQYDGESGSIAGKNIIEAFEGNDSVIFNESYIIIGEYTEALKIHAMYDLTIMGDVTAQECVVNGSLTVIGNARIKNITCQNGFICKGDLYSEKVYVGGNLIADSVVCDELICDGNAAIQTTANINQVAQIAKTIVACEGIMGAGKFTAQNAIANEYFEFDGDYEGKILELETDETICDTVPQNSDSYDTVEDVIALANKKLTEEYGKCSSLDEEQLIDHLRFLSGIENKELKVLPIVEPLFSKLADLSYKSRIETIEEYLTDRGGARRGPVRLRLPPACRGGVPDFDGRFHHLRGGYPRGAAVSVQQCDFRRGLSVRRDAASTSVRGVPKGADRSIMCAESRYSRWSRLSTR